MGKDTKKSNSLSWFEPAWGFRPRGKKAFAEVLNLGAWVRIFVAALLLAALLAYFTLRAIPDLEFNWIMGFCAAFGGAVLMVGVSMAQAWFIPPKISINSKGVCRTQSAVVWRLRADIARICLDQSILEKPRLRVEATGKRALEFGIAPGIDLELLRGFLRETFPEKLEHFLFR